MERVRSVRHIGGFTGLNIPDGLPLREAIQEALQSGDWDSELPLRLCEVMRFVRLGDHHAARMRMERTMRRCATEGSALQKCQVEFYQGFLFGLLGQRREAIAFMEPCYTHMLDQGWEQDAIAVGLQLMQNHMVLGQFEAAEATGEKGLALTVAMEDNIWAARYAIDLGACLVFQDKDRKALPIFRKALEHALRANNNHYYGFAVSNMGLVYYRKGWFLSAYRLFMDASNDFRGLKESYWEALMHCNIAMTLCWQDGKEEQGLLHLEEAHRVRKASGEPLPDDLKLDMAMIHERFGNPKRSLELVDELNDSASFQKRFVPGRQAWMGYLQLQNSQDSLALETLHLAYQECRSKGLLSQLHMVAMLLVRLGQEHPEQADAVSSILGKPMHDLSWLTGFIEDMDIRYWSVYWQVVLEAASCIFRRLGNPDQVSAYQSLLQRLRDRAYEDDIQRMMSRFPG